MGRTSPGVDHTPEPKASGEIGDTLALAQPEVASDPGLGRADLPQSAAFDEGMPNRRGEDTRALPS